MKKYKPIQQGWLHRIITTRTSQGMIHLANLLKCVKLTNNKIKENV